MGASLRGRKLLVTGASSGIGRAIAMKAMEAGGQVLATGRRTEGLDSANAATLRYVAGDLLDKDFVVRLALCAADVDILVNAAGFLKHAPFLESDPGDWDALFRLNVISQLHLTQLIARGMIERGAGQVLIITSTLAEGRPPPFTMAYAASKSALRTIVEGLRVELGGAIRVTEIAPGFTDSAIRRHIGHPAAQTATLARSNNALMPDDVAAAAIFAMTAPENVVPELIVVSPRVNKAVH